MTTHATIRTLVSSALVLAVLVGCGGGGGSSGPPPVPGGGGGSTIAPTPTTAPVVTPTPTPVPTSTPVPTFLGALTDYDTGAAIAGATITVGSGFSPPTVGTFSTMNGIVATATSGSSGAYSLTLPTGATYIQVNATGYATLHALAPAGGSMLATKLTAIKGDDALWLAQINASRAQYGVGTGTSPCPPDEHAMEVARYRVQDMAANGYFSHYTTHAATGTYDQSLSLPLYQALTGSLISNTNYFVFAGENLGQTNAVLLGQLTQAQWLGYVSGVNQDLSFISEGPTGGHFQRVTDPKDLWCGVAKALNGKTWTPGATAIDYYAEEYVVKF